MDIAGIRLKLTDDWRVVRKKYSFIFNSIGTALLGYLTIAPEAITNAWEMMPNEIKAFLPVKYSLYVTLTLFILGLISQYVKQAKLRAELDKANAKALKDLQDGTLKN